ncbi:MAG: hypothetical protein R2795_24050 [Saprospiraceae bacterium]
MKEKYILDLQEVPKGFEDIAEYLQRPLQEEEIRAKLRAEEEVETLFAQQEAEKAYYKRAAQEERKQKEQAIAQAHEARVKLARILLRTGMPVKDVVLETGLSEEEVRALVE